MDMEILDENDSDYDNILLKVKYIDYYNYCLLSDDYDLCI